MQSATFVAIALALAVSAVAAADVVKSSGSTDFNFIVKAARGGMAEVDLGQLAAERAQTDAVKKFGQQTADDHGRGGQELKSIAASRGIKLPAELDAQDKALRARLEKLHGVAFDRAYMRAMLSDHRRDVQVFQQESATGRDNEVKEWATKALPMLEEHMKNAQAANAAIKVTGSSSS